MPQKKTHEARDPHSSAPPLQAHASGRRAPWKTPALIELPPLTQLTLTTGFIANVSLHSTSDDRGSIV